MDMQTALPPLQQPTEDSIMNTRTALIRAAGIVAIALPAFAHAACQDRFGNGMCIYGSSQTGQQAERVVNVDKSARTIGVNYGETVKFVDGDKSFTWTFNGLGGRNVELSRIAPAGFMTHGLGVSVDRDPTFQ